MFAMLDAGAVFSGAGLEGGAGATRETETSRLVREAFFHRPLRSTMHSCIGRGKGGVEGFRYGRGKLICHCGTNSAGQDRKNS